ncbi:hypothetical protein QQF64_019575 [Cirrhinus molitorella]|uniref:Ig-like domain-containing protein n=1 Tax=Cirrhinus molitorella TaxID=172907 RepID=A0ABR3LFV0_9TELE
MKFVLELLSVLTYLLVYGVSDIDTDTSFVMEGDSVTLKYGIGITQGYSVTNGWIIHDKGYFSSICVHMPVYPKKGNTSWRIQIFERLLGEEEKMVKCKYPNQGLSDRVKVNRNGSLTITNTTVTDSGDYYLVSILDGLKKEFSKEKSNTVVVRGFFSFDTDGVSVMEGDSVTLHTGVQMKQKEKIRWYFNHTAIARILGDLSNSCTDVQCNEDADERFRDRLRLDHQTGSLTIRDIKTTDSGFYDLLINRVRRRSHRGHSSSSNTKIFVVAVHGVPAAEQDEMKRKSVMEGESVTLDTRIMKNPNNSITWHFNDIFIAEIPGDQSEICTDVQCDADERFRGRLKLDQQTGSLTIMKTRTTDSGLYKLQIRSSRFSIIRTFSVSATNGVLVSVMKRDSVILKSGVKTNKQEKIRWIFNDTLIAEITGDLSKICADVQCEDADERFRDRLKVNHQTGSLTIRYTRTTDSGLYKLQIIRERIHEKHFSVSIHDVPAHKQDEMKRKSVKEGESVTLDRDVIKNPDNLIKWYFDQTCIAEIKGDLRKICTDKQCKERFSDRLELDHQTGSLTITNTTIPDSGLYKRMICSIKICIITSFSVNVTGGPPFSMKKGDSVTLHTGVKTNQQEEIQWYFNDTLITEITFNLSEICTNVRCKERFRDRLKVDEFGSLTIMNIRTEDAGVYKLKISGSLIKIFNVSVTSYSVGSGKVSVMEGDFVTLHTDVETNQQQEIIWRFNDTIITEISGDLSFICTDVQCNDEGTERFRDRLKLDHQTGSLTITDINTTDSGIYELQIISSSNSVWRIVSITVIGVSAAEQDQMNRKSVKEGESVTLETWLTEQEYMLQFLLFWCSWLHLLVLFYKCHSRRKYIRTQHNDQANGAEDSSSNQTDPLETNSPNESSPNQTESETASETLT